MKTIVYYHKNCCDGFGAALALYTKYGDNAEYTPITYKDDPPAPEDHIGAQVYIVDFSLLPVDLVNLCKTAKEVILIDHHASAIRALGGVALDPPANLSLVLDTQHSGCVLAHSYLYPDGNMPALFKYLEDYDLWVHQYPESKYINEFLYSKPMVLSEWSSYLYNPSILAEGVRIGKLLYDVDMRRAKLMYKGAVRMAVEGTDDYVDVVNAPSMYSNKIGEVAEQDISQYPVLIYQNLPNSTAISLRVGGSYASCSKIAEDLGKLNNCRGGGHRGAAGIAFKGQFHTFTGLSKIQVR